MLVDMETQMHHTMRTSELKSMLCDRRREAQADIESRVRGTRAERSSDVREDLERADDRTRGDIELVLAQMSVDTVGRIDDAIGRLAAGKYGSCLECARDISERRLRALPFAVRCQACEGRRERADGQAHAPGQRDRGLSSLLDGLSP
jgi:DnaK suppressor protein